LKKFLPGILLTLFVLALTTVWLVQQPGTQTWLAQKTMEYIANTYGVKTNIGSVKIKFLNQIQADNFFIADKQSDTLFYFNNLGIDIGLWSLRNPKLVIQNIYLAGAVVNLYRNKGQTAFNYDFLLSTDTAAATQPADTLPLWLHIGHIQLNNTRLNYADTPGGQHLQLNLQKAALNFNRLNLNRSVFDIDQLQLNNGQITLNLYPADSLLLASLPKPAQTPPDTSQQTPMQVIVNHLNLQQFCLNYTDHTQKPANNGGIDPANLSVNDFETAITNLQYAGDSIQLQLQQLAFAEHSGFVCKQLGASVQYNPQGISLSGLVFETPKSVVQANFEVQYPNTDAFTAQPGSVSLQLNLPKMQLHEHDLFLLYPDVKSYQLLQPANTAIKAQTVLSGSLSNLLLQNTQVQLGNNTVKAKTIALTNPTNSKNLQYNITGLQLSTSYPALRAVFFPSLVPQQLTTLGNLQLTGNISGSMNHANVLAKLVSDAGNVDADVAVRLAQPMQYKGKVALYQFEAGKVAQMDSLIGQMTLAATFDMQDTDPEKITGNAQINLLQAQLMGYNYQNAQLNLGFDRNSYTANVTVNDPALQIQLQANANLRNPLPQIAATANLQHLNTTALGLYNWNYTLGTQLQTNLQGNSAENISGTLELNNTRFTRNDTTRILKDVSINISDKNNAKTIDIQSDIANANLSGRFKPDMLASGIMRTINRYYRAFPDTFTNYTLPQQAEFNLKMKDIALLQQLFVPELKRLDTCMVSGKIDETGHVFEAKMYMRNAAYDTYLLETANLTSGNESGKLVSSVQLKQLHIQADTTETVLPGADLGINMTNDSLLLNLQVQTDTTGIALGLHNLLTTINGSTYSVQLLDDTLVLNNKIWQVKPDNALTLSANGIEARNFRLGYGSGQLSINNKEPGNPLSPLLVVLSNFSLQDLGSLAGMDSLNMGGSLNGDVEISSPTGDMSVAAQLLINQMSYEGAELGNLQLQTRYDKTGIVPIDLSLAGQFHEALLKGSYNLNDTVNALNLGLDLQKIDLSGLQPVMEGAINNLGGTLFGKVRIEGAASAPRLSGGIQLQQAAMQVPATNTAYTLSNAKLRIEPGGFHLEPAALVDQTGSALNLQADIEHRNFDNINLNLHAWGSNLQLMNTKTASPDMPAYGTINGNLDVKVNGSTNNPDIKVFFETGKNTDIYVSVPESESNIQKEQLVTFGSQNARIDSLVQKMNDREQKRKEQAEAAALNYNFTLKLAANNNARLNIVIDPAAGDQLSCNGEGNMTVETNAKGDLMVAGDYTIDQGSYQMTLNDLVKRKFAIERGSTLNFAGDPMATRFNITAIYQIETPAYDMVSEFADQLSEDEISKLKKKQPVQVALSIKGTIAEPKLAFNILLPRLQEEPNTLVERKLAQIRENDTELNKQSFGLIMFNRFIPASNVPNVGTPDAEEIVYSSLSKMVSDQLNNLAGKYVKGMEIMVNVESEGAGDTKNRELQYGVSQQLFNERMTIQVGGTVNLDNQQQNNASLAPDVAVEYKVTKDGKVKARVFRKDRYHQLSQLYRPTTGAAITYKRKFGQLKELFRKRKTG